jgi:hypothetical protein
MDVDGSGVLRLALQPEASPAMKFIVASGLTRRLVEADDPRAARVKFLQAVPRGNVLKVPHERVRVYAATEADVADFKAGKRKAKFDGQTELDLGDPVGMENLRRGISRSRKEPS